MKVLEMKKKKVSGSGRQSVSYVLDTTTILYRPDIFYHLQGRIYVPMAAIKEIDGHKRADGDRGAAARKAARILDVLGSYEEYDESKNVADGVSVSTGGSVIVYPFADDIDVLASEADNRIVGAAIRIKRETGENVVLLTSDINMRTVARAYKIKARLYPAYAEDVHKDINRASTRGTVVSDVPGSAETPESAATHKAGFRLRALDCRKSFAWLRFLSPLYWFQKFLRYCLRDKESDFFWTMNDETYRLCTEYRQGEPGAAKRR